MSFFGSLCLSHGARSRGLSERAPLATRKLCGDNDGEGDGDGDYDGDYDVIMTVIMT
jgi:hypothetical protein